MKAKEILKKYRAVDAAIAAAAKAGENAWDLLQKRKSLWRAYITARSRFPKTAKKRPSWA